MTVYAIKVSWAAHGSYTELIDSDDYIEYDDDGNLKEFDINDHLYFNDTKAAITRQWDKQEIKAYETKIKAQTKRFSQREK